MPWTWGQLTYSRCHVAITKERDHWLVKIAFECWPDSEARDASKTETNWLKYASAYGGWHGKVIHHEHRNHASVRRSRADAFAKHNRSGEGQSQGSRWNRKCYWVTHLKAFLWVLTSFNGFLNYRKKQHRIWSRDLHERRKKEKGDSTQRINLILKEWLNKMHKFKHRS